MTASPHIGIQTRPGCVCGCCWSVCKHWRGILTFQRLLQWAKTDSLSLHNCMLSHPHRWKERMVLPGWQESYRALVILVYAVYRWPSELQSCWRTTRMVKSHSRRKVLFFMYLFFPPLGHWTDYTSSILIWLVFIVRCFFLCQESPSNRICKCSLLQGL